MCNMKRTCRMHGRCIGHMYEGELLGYIEARKKIYIPSYYYMLEHFCAKSIETIKKLSDERTVVLLDYDTNEDIEDSTKPMSHAGLIKKYIKEYSSID